MKKVFKVIALYHKDAMRPTTIQLSGEVTSISGQMRARPTGHWVLAEDHADALRIARAYRIGNPMGSQDIESWEMCCTMDKVPACKNVCRGFEYGKKYGGKVWEEVDGELIGHETPYGNPNDQD